MATVLPTVDLSPIQAAIEADDARTVERIGRELGIELGYATLLHYIHRFERRYAAGVGRDAFRLFYMALHDASGYAVDSRFGYTMLAVRRGATLVFGLQSNHHQRELFPEGGWQMGRWFKDPARNRPTVEAWATHIARSVDSLRIPITHAPAQTSAIDDRGDALLAAVTANPDDDAARLVYADWLVEQGDARGELIRVQCELTVHQPPDRRAALRERERELLSSLSYGMKAAVEHFTEGFGIGRGLIDYLYLFVVKLAKYGPEAVAKHPITRVRILCNGEKEFARLAKLGFLRAIPSIEIESRKTPKVIMSRAVMKPSAQPSLFTTTRRLEFADLADTADEWRAWLTTVEAPVLEELRLIRSTIDLAGYELFANPLVLPALRCLEVAFPPFAQTTAERERLVAAVEAIAGARTLVEYRFTSWHVDDATLARCVAAMLRCPTLTRLVIDNCRNIGERTAEAVRDGGGRLVHLQLDDLDGASLASVVGALGALQSLSCDVHTGRGHAIDAIAKAATLRELHWEGSPQLAPDERARLAHLDLR